MILRPRRPSLRAAPALALAALAGAAIPAPDAAAADAAVVFMYHRFGESGAPSTNVRLEQFEAQLRELKSGGYAVLPLPDIVAALKARRPLPDKTVAITIDDAFRSVYAAAWPRLRAAGLPFTLFVATDLVDRGKPGHMRWDEIRALARAGATIAAHSAGHVHMAGADDAANRREIAHSNARLHAELGAAPSLFAYPYGEASRAVAALVAREGGYAAAFGQHSGVMHAGSDFLYLPRFAVNEHYGEIERFRLAASALPLPVGDVTPADPLLGPGGNPPAFGFTVGPDVARRLASLACYSSHEGRLRLERLGDRRIEVRMARPFPPGRGRVNCTMPGPDDRWRWFGTQFYIPNPTP